MEWSPPPFFCQSGFESIDAICSGIISILFPPINCQQLHEGNAVGCQLTAMDQGVKDCRPPLSLCQVR